MSATAVILARAGSKGVPGKNMMDIAGRPCLGWTLEHALATPAVSRVVLSSDDDRALSLGEQAGAVLHRRPARLASDDARVDEAAIDALTTLDGQHWSSAAGPVVVLYASVPVRPSDLTARALHLLEASGCDSAQSFAKVGKHHPWWTAQADDQGRLSGWGGGPLFNNCFRRQDLPPALVPDGGVMAMTRASLAGLPGAAPGPHAFLGIDRRAVITGQGEVIDIDAPIDAVVAAAVLRAR